jgi:hypothetical protein
MATLPAVKKPLKISKSSESFSYMTMKPKLELPDGTAYWPQPHGASAPVQGLGTFAVLGFAVGMK